MKNFKHHRLLFALILLFLTLGTLTAAFGQITPSQDSYTNSATPTSNYGLAPTLGVVSSASSIQNTYIQFDLSSIPAGYTSSNVAKATLKFYVNSVAAAGSFNVDFVNGSWKERTITANLAPTLGGTIAGSVPLTAANAGDYLLIDVTTAVGEWLNNSQPNDGIALVANSGLSATFDSKENANQSHPAELDIVFTSGGTITGVDTASGSGLSGGGNSGTLNLSLQKNCASNQVLQWNGSAWVCASAGTGTISGVKAGTDLIGGGNSGNVTLNLDLTKVPQLNTGNSFTGSQVVNGNVSATGQLISTVPNGTPPLSVSSSTPVANLNAAFLEGQTASSFAQLNGFNLFLGQTTFGNFTTFNAVTTMNLDLQVEGGGIYMIAGNPGCGLGYAGIGFKDLSGCTDYSMAGNGTDTLLNRPSGGYMLFRENNGDEMAIAPGGNVGIGTTSPGAALEIHSGGGFSTPQAYLVQTNTSDYARLRFNLAGGGNPWDIAVGGGSTPDMNFYRPDVGNAISLTPKGSSYMTMGNGAYLSSGGAWTNSSDRNLKTGFRPVSGRDILRRLNALPITTWNYKSENGGVRHLGPMAQDFRAAFGLGQDDKHITTIDEGGVALAAIQELSREVSQKQVEIAKLRAEVEKLQHIEDRLASLEARLAQFGGVEISTMRPMAQKTVK